MPHSIRLAGPWEIRVGDGPSRTVRVPLDLFDFSACGETLTLTRRSNRPANLGEETRLFLCVEDCGRPITVDVDGETLAGRAAGPLRLEIQNPLTMSPALRISLQPASDRGESQTFQPVRLEIVEPWDDESVAATDAT